MLRTFSRPETGLSSLVPLPCFSPTRIPESKLPRPLRVECGHENTHKNPLVHYPWFRGPLLWRKAMRITRHSLVNGLPLGDIYDVLDFYCDLSDMGYRQVSAGRPTFLNPRMPSEAVFRIRLLGNLGRDAPRTK